MKEEEEEECTHTKTREQGSEVSSQLFKKLHRMHHWIIDIICHHLHWINYFTESIRKKI